MVLFGWKSPLGLGRLKPNSFNKIYCNILIKYYFCAITNSIAILQNLMQNCILCQVFSVYSNQLVLSKNGFVWAIFLIQQNSVK